MRHFTSFALLVLIVATTSARAEQGLLQKVELSGFKAKTMQTDFPARDVSLSANGERAWVLGEQFLWRWSLADGQVSKINIVKRAELPCSTNSEKLYPRNDDIVAIVGPCYFTLVDLAKKTRISYRHPLFRGGETLGFRIRDGEVTWIHTDGTLSIPTEGGKIKQIWSQIRLTPKDQILIGEKTKTAWIARETFLFKQALDHPEGEIELLYKTDKPIKKIFMRGNEVLLSEGNNLLRFNNEGYLLQTIKIAESRKLTAANFGGGHDVYVFEDGLVEGYDLKAKNKKYDYVDVAGKLGVAKIAGQTAIYIDHGAPVVYSFSSF